MNYTVSLMTVNYPDFAVFMISDNKINGYMTLQVYNTSVIMHNDKMYTISLMEVNQCLLISLKNSFIYVKL